MKQLFKNQRKELFPKSRIKKYLLYGLGEIILVVIGILLAVQINNLNESHKNRRNEIFILHEIAENLEVEGQRIDAILAQRTKTQASILRINASLATPANFVEDTFSYDMAQLLTFERYFPIRTSYEVAKVNGLPITNKELRGQIADYSEYEQNVTQKSLGDIEAAFMNDFPTIPSEHYFIEAYAQSVRLTDFRNVSFLTALEKVLSFFIPNHSGTLHRMQEFKAANAKITAAVLAELERLE
ncbi:MAG: DUF6090 family protein [Bacteroidota bacterium]